MFPQRGNNVGAMRRQCTIEHLQMKFGSTISKHGIFCNIVTLPGQYVSAPKFAMLAGGYYPPLQKPRNIRSVIQWHRPRRGGYHPPGCFPCGETTSAQCADNAVSNILQGNSAVQYRNTVYFATLLHYRANTFLPQNLPCWQADTIRPYKSLEISAR